jgi:hypothetical protein
VIVCPCCIAPWWTPFRRLWSSVQDRCLNNGWKVLTFR